MMLNSGVPVIALDGPTASGKGTVAMHIAAILGWHVLDSGAIYRLAALTVMNHQVLVNDLARISALARDMDIQFEKGRILLDGVDVTSSIRQENVGNLASELAREPVLRQALLERQRAFRILPGLVADGRDMGTVVFPDAPLKIFLVADVNARAQRRYRQLVEKGEPADYDIILTDLKARDDRDMNRSVAPLKPAEDAHIIDSSVLTVDQTVERVLAFWRQCPASSMAG